jgi:hypothetical protein
MSMEGNFPETVVPAVKLSIQFCMELMLRKHFDGVVLMETKTLVVHVLADGVRLRL